MNYSHQQREWISRRDSHALPRHSVFWRCVVSPSAMLVLSGLFGLLTGTGESWAQVDPPKAVSSALTQSPPESSRAADDSSKTTPRQDSSLQRSVKRNSAQESSTQGNSLLDGSEEATLREIEAIRQRMGGGLSREFEEINEVIGLMNPSKGSLEGIADGGTTNGGITNGATDHSVSNGSVPDDTTDGTGGASRLFRAELRQLIVRRGQPIPLPASDMKTGCAIGLSDDLTPRPEDGMSQTRLEPVETHRRLEAQECLRRCARNLESVASDLESLNQPETADALRGHAMDLWRKARLVP